MTTRQDLEALLERVKSAVGPDQIADAMLAEIVRGPGHGYVPYYTADLNAIVALIERELPGWMWAREHSDGHAYVRLLDPEYARYEFMGARNSHAVSSARGADDNVPLALCAAFLAAKLLQLPE